LFFSVSTKNVPHQLDSSAAHKLLAALPECNEWGQVTILDSIAAYRPESPEQAEKIVERVRPRLQHANSAVVLSASKVSVPVNIHRRFVCFWTCACSTVITRAKMATGDP